MGGIGCQTFSSNPLRVIYGKPRTLRAQRCSTGFEQRCMRAPLLNEFPIISTNAAARIDCYRYACGARVLICLPDEPREAHDSSQHGVPWLYVAIQKARAQRGLPGYHGSGFQGMSVTCNQ